MSARTAARTVELDRERERTADQAIALDRVRIGRELHDVVAHHVSVMGVQAGAARRPWQSDRRAAVASLVAIESARQAVDELHQLVSTLRDDDTDRRRRPSTRTTASSNRSSTRRAAPIPVRFRVVGEPGPSARRRPDPLPGRPRGGDELPQARRCRAPRMCDCASRRPRRARDGRLGRRRPPPFGRRTRAGRDARTGRGDRRHARTGSRDRGGYLVRASIPAVEGRHDSRAARRRSRPRAHWPPHHPRI